MKVVLTPRGPKTLTSVRTSRGLSCLFFLRSVGNLQQALVCFEKRLVVAHELGGHGGSKAQAYGELGTLHSQLGNYEQALSCLEHQLNLARAAGVRLQPHEPVLLFGSVKVCPVKSEKQSSS